MLEDYFELVEFFKKRKNLGIKPGLERVSYLLKSVSSPEKHIQAIHVAGTNGKGSTIEFIQNALIASGYKVGVFTSPSFTGLRGHFLINRQEISEADLIILLNELLPGIKVLDDQENYPTEYEILTVLGLLYFKRHVDIALIETAMGGTYDTTNCIDPILSVITNVSYDHLDFLGDTLTKITRHKAGIIKQRRPVVIGKVKQISEEVIRERAENLDAETYFLGEAFNVKNDRISLLGEELPVSLSMRGEHQLKNAATALMVLRVLAGKEFKVDWTASISAINETNLIGRFEQVKALPRIILDSAHNTAAMAAFISTVHHEFPAAEKYILFSAFKDKQVSEMIIQLKDAFSKINITTFDHPRAISNELIAAKYKVENNIVVDNWQTELAHILTERNPNKIYFITGSLHFITIVRKYIKEYV